MEKKLTMDKVAEFVLILAISAVISLIGNTINTITDGNPDTFVSILDGLPGMLILFAIAIVSTLLNAVFPKIPTIIYITFIGIILGMPYSPTGAYVAEQVNKIGLLPSVTPVLAYAGVSMGKDWLEFKKIGWRGIVVAIFVMIGTYVGSALIAQIILSAQGII
ncbi:MAG TPA: hypothetical protein IAA44_11275 [Candidatus Blautia avistercoris]|uniref:hypothetical protein n=1 Tax=Blautia sp. An249 TaxID=1965603 RepID=UPI000B3931C5|nr:hypothetical protein [Blautia sp. An249]OUO79309.1 hypothetical protein B5F53_07420 [Blautia sp. An249]HIY19977.1 hypothetical protein [Candidatus Blautia avistercoris]